MARLQFVVASFTFVGRTSHNDYGSVLPGGILARRCRTRPQTSHPVSQPGRPSGASVFGDRDSVYFVSEGRRRSIAAAAMLRNDIGTVRAGRLLSPPRADDLPATRKASHHSRVRAFLAPHQKEQIERWQQQAIDPQRAAVVSSDEAASHDGSSRAAAFGAKTSQVTTGLYSAGRRFSAPASLSHAPVPLSSMAGTPPTGHREVPGVSSFQGGREGVIDPIGFAAGHACCPVAGPGPAGSPGTAAGVEGELLDGGVAPFTASWWEFVPIFSASEEEGRPKNGEAEGPDMFGTCAVDFDEPCWATCSPGEARGGAPEGFVTRART